MVTASEEGLLLNVIFIFNPEQTTKERERVCVCQHAIFTIPAFVLGKRLMGIILPVSMLPPFRIVILN